MTSSFFSRARHTRIGHNSVLQHVEGDVYQNYISCATCPEEEENRVMPKQKQYREIFEGDIFLQKLTWSQEMKVAIREPRVEREMPWNGEEARVIVIKKFHAATIYPHNNTATVVTFEPKEKMDTNTTRLLWQHFYEAYSAHRSSRLVQMLGLMRAEMPTFILYEDLVNGGELTSRYAYTHYLVFDHLFCTHCLAISALRADKSLRIPVSWRWEDWTFNLRTQSWHYDASASIEQPDEDYYRFTPAPLPEGPLPKLDAESITTYFENTFGDFVYLIASLGGTTQLYLSDYAQYGRLTFGAVFDDWESEILAHFPSTPRSEWRFENRSHNVNVGYSEKVPSRVDFQFHNTQNTRLNLYFSSRLPLEDRSRLRTAYLCQSDKHSDELTYFIDEIGFSVTGSFSRGLKTCSAPVYLFVPPLHVEYIDGMYCIPHPLPDPLFYWSWDPKGKTVISEIDWEQSGIPQLEVETWVGSYWVDEEYRLIKSHLHTKNYDIDGKQYAQDHGYPELIWGDPHARRIVELKDTDSDEDFEDFSQHGDSEELDGSCCSTSQSAYSSTSLFVDLPVERALAHAGEQFLNSRHETNTDKSVEETRRVRGQHFAVQDTKCQPDSSKPIAQKQTPLRHSPTYVSYTATKRAKQSQATTPAKMDARDNISARTARPPAQGMAAAISNSQKQPKRAAQKSPGTKTTGVGAGQTSTPARRTQTAGRVVITPSKSTKQPEPEDREVTPAKPSPPPARTTRTQTTRTNATVKKAWR
ncbi:hypothetical protein PM082_019682 [Marasmius tenuissimus]|nr:hypothetical protein PM082_019682 [Marasmius tenuissimus]